MRLTLERKYKKQAYTIGRLSIEGKYFCDTLEDKVRELGKDGSGKIRGVTAIPAGEYEIRVTYSPKFRRKLPYLMSVPFFEGIRIHSGNTAKDTEGCILVGRNTAKGRLTESRKTEERLTELLLAAQAAGDTITINIV